MKKWNRILAFVLALTLAWPSSGLGMIPVQAAATDNELLADQEEGDVSPETEEGGDQTQLANPEATVQDEVVPEEPTEIASGDEQSDDGAYATDFTDVSDWEEFSGWDGGTWTVGANEYHIDQGNGNKSLLKEKTFSEFTYEADVRVNARTGINSAQGGLLFRVTDVRTDAHGDGYNGYYFGIDVENNTVILGKVLGENKDQWHQIGTKKMTLEFGATYHLKVDVSGNHIVGYVNDVNDTQEHYAKIDLIDDSFAADGRIGVRNWMSSADFANVKVTPYTEEEENGFTNALIGMCADPDVLYHDGTYYLYPTNAGDENDDEGIKVYTSTDLVNWVDQGFALKKADVWGEKNFWAPDVIERDGTFYMYYTAEEQICVATSDSPLGPYKQEEKAPLHEDVKEIDAHVFKDEDNQYYLYFVRFDHGNVVEGAILNEDMHSIDESSRVRLLTADQSWEKDMGNINEGPYMLKKDGVYYLTYSGSHFQSPQYGSGYATSDHPLGTFAKYENNPIMQSNDVARGTGHHGITQTPDGDLYIIYHRHKSTTETEPRELCIDRMQFTKDMQGKDVLEVKGPTVTSQAAPEGLENVKNFLKIDQNNLKSMSVRNGIEAAKWGLPKQVTIITSQGKEDVDVAWDTTVYDKNDHAKRELTISGTIVLPADVKNPGSVSASCEIKVTINEFMVQRLEAEDAILTAPAGIASNNNASGGKKVGWIDNADATVTFTLDAPTKGAYRVDVIAGSGCANAAHKYYLNGNVADAQTIKYSNGGWDNWSAYPIQVELEAGTNTLTFTHGDMDDSFSELDCIDFYRVKTTLDGITLDGEALESFDWQVHDYEVDVENLEGLQSIGANMSEDMKERFEVTVKQATVDRPEALVSLICEEMPELNQEYRVRFITPGAFTNPLVNYGADPYVTYQDGYYYYVRVLQDSEIYVSKTSELSRIGQVEPVLVYKPKAGEPNQSMWAPEIHYLRGKWYIYYTAGNDAAHRMYAVECDTPQGTYQFTGKLAPDTDRWAIDQTVLEHNGKMYAIWSGWDGFDNVDQRTYIAEMSNPWTIVGERVELSKPEYDWELLGSGNGLPTINEGAQVVKSPIGIVNILYSASGSWSDDYCMGALTLKEDGDPMNAADWKKSDQPVFKKNMSSTYSTGHASFVTSPDGTEDYIVYHATRGNGEGWAGRGVRAQRFYWNEDGTVDIGMAIDYNSRVNLPSGTIVPARDRYEAESGELHGKARVESTYNSSNGQKVTGLTERGDAVKLNVTTAKAGTYKLYVGAATIDNNAGFDVQMNNQTAVQKHVFPLNSLSGHPALCVDNWVGYELEVKLKAGVNTVVISKSEDLKGVDIDYIELELLSADVVDSSKLKEMYQKYVGIKATDYEDAGYKVLKAELDKAGKILNNPDTTQQEVDAAIKTLQDAFNKLVPKSLKALKASITQVAKLKSSDYTTTSWANLQKVLTQANAVVKKQNATEAEVKKANDDLQKAIKNLAKKPPTVPKKGTKTTIGNYVYTVTKADAKNGTVTLTKPTKKTLKTVSIPATVTINSYKFQVTGINAKAFSKNIKLTKVTIGSNIKTIGSQAFYGCTNLKTVKFGKNVTSIGSKAFYNCKKIKTITLGNAVKSIGSQAFYGCASLQTVKIGKGLTTIGSKAFYNCKKLKALTISSTKLTKVSKDAFKKTAAKLKVKVPKAKVKKYKKLFKSAGIAKTAVVK